MGLFQAFVGTFAVILMVKTFSRFPDTSFSFFTFVVSSIAYGFSFSVENEVMKLVLFVLGSMVLLAGFGTILARK